MFQTIAQKLLAGHGYDGRPWAMSMAERFAIATILAARQPKVALEIGTLEGGSLSVISHYSERVYSLDLNPACAEKLGSDFANTTFLTGPSQETLPPLLERLKEAEIGFVLVDGDHSEEGVFCDIKTVLTYQPKDDLYVLMHDSFNPACRRGMKRVDWASYPHVHWIDYDFVPGFLNSVPGYEDEMWCGFALAYLKAEPRAGDLPQDELLARQYEALLPLANTR